MNLLALDTSTDLLSVAVQAGDAAPLCFDGPGGAQASASLIPAVLRLLAQADLTLAQLQAIAFGAGPGSFTGLRSACAVAQGLGYGAGVPLLPVDTLLAVAEEARLRALENADASPAARLLAADAPCAVLVTLDARMDEVYAARYLRLSGQWLQLGDWQVLKPERLQPTLDGLPPGVNVPADLPWLLVGNAAAVYGPRLPDLPSLPSWPSARALLALAPALLAAGQAVPAAQALPRYVRDKVAQTTAEREALQAAKLANAQGAA